MYNSSKEADSFFEYFDRTVAKKFFQSLANEDILTGIHIIGGNDRRSGVRYFANEDLAVSQFLLDPVFVGNILGGTNHFNRVSIFIENKLSFAMDCFHV